ncbi:MAG: serine hydrolase domain-containing protein [Pseudomonadota bacterium]
MYSKNTVECALFSVFCTAIVFICPNAGAAFAQSRASDQPHIETVDTARLKQRIDETVIEWGIPSTSVAVANGTAPIWAYASGFSDKEQRQRATADTRYRLASVSKPITAVAVMMLADRGLIDLDAPANNYLGNAKIETKIGDARDVIVRRLMSHRAGLPPHYNLIHAGENYARRSLDESISLYGKAMLRPGLTQRYSNIGYAVLERIIEQVSGKSYGEFLREELFEPLDMESADVFTSPVDPMNTAIPYTRAGDRYRSYDIDTRGAGGVFMTAKDLVRFGRFFSDALDGKSELLSAAAALEMLEMQSPEQADKVEYYSLGWVHELRGDNREHDTIYHLGSTPGVRAELWIYPDRDLVVATLLNEMNYRALYHVREAMIATYAPDITTEPFPAIKIPDTLAHQWEGVIDLGPDGQQTVSFDFTDINRPLATIDGKEVKVLAAGDWQDGLFQIRTEHAQINTRDAQRQPYRLGFILEPGDSVLKGYVTVNRIATRDRDSGNYSYWTVLQKKP